MLEAAGKILVGPIEFRGQHFASRQEALVSALGQLDTWAQINRLNDEDRQHGRMLWPPGLSERLRSGKAGLQRALQSLTDRDGKILSVICDAIVEAAAGEKPADDILPPLRPEDAVDVADVESLARILWSVGGDIGAAPELARRLKTDEADSQRVKHAIAEMRWLAERLDRAKAGAIDDSPDPDSERLLDDICVIWTEILGRKVGASTINGPFMRFAEACLVLLGAPQSPGAIRWAARRWHKRRDGRAGGG